MRGCVCCGACACAPHMLARKILRAATWGLLPPKKLAVRHTMSPLRWCGPVCGGRAFSRSHRSVNALLLHVVSAGMALSSCHREGRRRRTVQQRVVFTIRSTLPIDLHDTVGPLCGVGGLTITLRETCCCGCTQAAWCGRRNSGHRDFRRDHHHHQRALHLGPSEEMLAPAIARRRIRSARGASHLYDPLGGRKLLLLVQAVYAGPSNYARYYCTCTRSVRARCALAWSRRGRGVDFSTTYVGAKAGCYGGNLSSSRLFLSAPPVSRLSE